MTVTIAPVEGDAACVPVSRAYEIVAHGVRSPETCSLRLNGKELEFDSRYDAELEALFVTVKQVRPTDSLTLTVTAERTPLRSQRDRRAEKIWHALRHFKLDSRVKARIDADLPRLLSGELNLSRYALSAPQRDSLKGMLACC